MESYDAGSRTPSRLEATDGASFERTVSARPDREALVEISSGCRWTWAELNTAANDGARGLLERTITAGDFVPKGPLGRGRRASGLERSSMA